MRVAVDEINAFLLTHQMLIYLVVFDQAATKLGMNLYPDLEAYVDHNYVQEMRCSLDGWDKEIRDDYLNRKKQ